MIQIVLKIINGNNYISKILSKLIENS